MSSLKFWLEQAIDNIGNHACNKRQWNHPGIAMRKTHRGSVDSNDECQPTEGQMCSETANHQQEQGHQDPALEEHTACPKGLCEILSTDASIPKRWQTQTNVRDLQRAKACPGPGMIKGMKLAGEKGQCAQQQGQGKERWLDRDPIFALRQPCCTQRTGRDEDTRCREHQMRRTVLC